MMKDGDSGDTIQFETIRLQDYLNWFERHLISIASFDLDDLLTALSRLDDNTITLKNLASEYKSSLAVLSPSQSNKAQKIIDQIDALALFLPNASTISPPSSSSNSSATPLPSSASSSSSSSSSSSTSISNKAAPPVLSTLPDSEQLRDIILKNKSKLKSVEDLASSSRKVDAGKAKAGGVKSSSGSSSSVPASASSSSSLPSHGGPARKADKSGAAVPVAGAGAMVLGGDVGTVRQEARHGLLLLEELEALIVRKSFMLVDSIDISCLYVCMYVCICVYQPIYLQYI